MTENTVTPSGIFVNMHPLSEFTITCSINAFDSESGLLSDNETKTQVLATLTRYSLFNQITYFKNILQNGNSCYDTQTKEGTGISFSLPRKLMQFHRPLFAQEIRN